MEPCGTWPAEQLQRNLLDVDRRADVYALGATLYELVTDLPFFDGDTEARLIEQVLRETPVPARTANPAVPDDLSTVIAKATDRDPGLRYQTGRELAEDLEAYATGRPIAARPPTLGYLLRLAIRRNKALAGTVAVAVLLVAVVTGVFSVLARRRRVTGRWRRRAKRKPARPERWRRSRWRGCPGR